ncbi:NADP-dependent phosphogluconate dehydrogenase [Elizabethkingia anophelis]|uniref:6-phosphogluconate dehydrogenase, decarboxylating n=1 Tax=Elizabethkingia anophelis NUHP1 TaxID=1338011 RepID=A0A077EG79_9FLAO|nr:NADP-dependent phosphogluconate dehydrogenase [Elizabethkingia anophelis]AIL46462.1 6-phosphogluconate dehydrogenase, decarboxylating [Elizabethkingia anophelis NUHP1]MBE9394484.1 NADP-dependent phosphogluconate dehydrogenase [Elizabethkingia anophelis]MBE9407335.1 NADP-dependent phosphogluconate dehydrogenase [Elizabethkingia anophelis]MCT4013494.1 NADP-dependent phosphogluconate dehydrogenase [Elizabethkingia anophelis]MDV3899235.1 phosphogluconate dehydrogenase (NADP(+)-dependent, decarb
MEKYNYGVIGLGVMGRNLLYNIADHNFSVAGFDLDEEKVKELHDGATSEMKVKGSTTLEDFVSALESPRKIILMVPAGKPVDAVLGNITPLLSPGDIVVDAGNSYFEDTNRRIADLAAKNLHFMGMGVSGGEKGARTGPSIMPGGDLEAFRLLQPMLEAISAKVGNEACTAYMGKSSAGNYVKMVHNGIEYAIMQLISEAYDLLKRGANLNNDQLYEVFKEWNNGEMNSFLIEITRDIFQQKDALTDAYLVDKILDKAGAKGTGKWTSEQAMEIGVSIPTIDVAVTSRIISAYKDERVQASKLYSEKEITSPENTELFIKEVGDALYLATLISYAQGLALLVKASKEYDFQIPLQDVVKIWRGGCIIRSVLLEKFYTAYSKNPELSNILLDQDISVIVKEKIASLRKTASYAALKGIPALGTQSALGYFDAYTTESLPVNLIQAQRDYFGAHTYQRVDQEGTFHTSWLSANN